MILIDLIHACFQDVNRLFLLSFEDNASRTIYKQYFLPTIEIKDYNVMINGQNFFDQPVKMLLRHMITFQVLQMVKEMTTQLVLH